MSKCQYCLQEHEDTRCKKDDLLTALDYYETQRFYNNMKDRWSSADYSFDSKMFDYICKIKNLLEVISSENTNSNN